MPHTLYPGPAFVSHGEGWRADGNNTLVFFTAVRSSALPFASLFRFSLPFPRCVRLLPASRAAGRMDHADGDRTYLAGAGHYAGAVGDANRSAGGVAMKQHSVGDAPSSRLPMALVLA